MISTPGLVLECPAEASAAGPIPITATLVADRGTSRANASQARRALTVALVRRDAPGIVFLATFPREAVPAPHVPMPPDVPGPMLGPTVASVTKERVALSPLDGGRTHDGAAEYAVVGAFATWTDGPKPLEVKHPDRRLPWHDAVPAPQPLPEIRSLPEPPRSRGLVAAVQQRRGRPHVEGAFRSAIPRPVTPGEKPPPAFVTIFAPRLAPRGGASGQVFLVTAQVDGADYVGRFSIPLSALAPEPEKGKHRLFVFAGGEAAPPFEVDLP